MCLPPSWLLPSLWSQGTHCSSAWASITWSLWPTHLLQDAELCESWLPCSSLSALPRPGPSEVFNTYWINSVIQVVSSGPAESTEWSQEYLRSYSCFILVLPSWGWCLFFWAEAKSLHCLHRVPGQCVSKLELKSRILMRARCFSCHGSSWLGWEKAHQNCHVEHKCTTLGAREGHAGETDWPWALLWNGFFFSAWWEIIEGTPEIVWEMVKGSTLERVQDFHELVRWFHTPQNMKHSLPKTPSWKAGT